MQPRGHHHSRRLRTACVEMPRRAQPVGHHRPGPRCNQRDCRDVSCQRPFQLTCAQAREVIEVTVLGSLAKRFHAAQQASTMAS